MSNESLPGGHELLLTRRHFLYGVAGVAALAAVGGGAAWAAGRSNDDDALKTLKVPEGAVTAQSSLEKMESYEDAVTLAWARIFSVAWGYCVISHTPRRPYGAKRYNKRKHDCRADIWANCR